MRVIKIMGWFLSLFLALAVVATLIVVLLQQYAGIVVPDEVDFLPSMAALIGAALLVFRKIQKGDFDDTP